MEQVSQDFLDCGDIVDNVHPAPGSHLLMTFTVDDGGMYGPPESINPYLPCELRPGDVVAFIENRPEGYKGPDGCDCDTVVNAFRP